MDTVNIAAQVGIEHNVFLREGHEEVTLAAVGAGLHHSLGIGSRLCIVIASRRGDRPDAGLGISLVNVAQAIERAALLSPEFVNAEVGIEVRYAHVVKPAVTLEGELQATPMMAVRGR